MLRLTLGRDGFDQAVVGALQQSDTPYSIVLAAGVSQQIQLPSVIAGAIASGTFQLAETVTQASSGAYAKVLQIGPTLIAGPVTGTPDATHTWTGGTSGATYTPSAIPGPVANFVLFTVSGANDFWMKFANAAIAVPGANITDGSAPELKPLIRSCTGKTYVSLVSAVNCIVTMAFFS
ncbi:MAG: hypothetical protein ABSG91_15265 [Syntrophobacteraceae bacterium]|jgi:hypothetical protein